MRLYEFKHLPVGVIFYIVYAEIDLDIELQ